MKKPGYNHQQACGAQKSQDSAEPLHKDIGVNL